MNQSTIPIQKIKKRDYNICICDKFAIAKLEEQ